MKFFRILAAAAIVVSLTASTAFAVPNPSDSSNANESQQKIDNTKNEKKDFKGKEFKHGCGSLKQKDPIKALERKKEEIQSELKQGKITKEKADEKISKIDLKIKSIQEFNKLTLPQKKEKLTNSFKASIEKRVKDGRLTQDKANEIVIIPIPDTFTFFIKISLPLNCISCL